MAMIDYVMLWLFQLPLVHQIFSGDLSAADTF